jgi:hypothetical protein
MGRWRQFVLSSALALAATCLAVAAVEAALRVQQALEPQKPRPPARGFFFRRHPEIGWVHPSSYEGLWYDDHGEYQVTVAMNSKGLRDVEHDYAKAPGTYRILVLGDSYVEALQVRLEETFPRLLEKELNRSGRRVEVVNTGVADWGTDHELVYFRVEGVKYDADLVLLAFTTANDVRNNSPVLNAAVPNPNLYKPTFSLAEDGSLRHRPPPRDEPPPPAPPPPRAPDRPAWRRLLVVELVASRLRRTSPIPAPQAGAAVAKDSAVATPRTDPQARASVATDMLVYSPTYTDEVAEAWRLTKALVSQLRQEVEGRGAKFAVVLVNGPWAHYDEPWRLMLLGDREAQTTWDRRRPNLEIGPFLSSSAIPYVDLMEPFEIEKTGERLFFQRDPHWTPAGHRVAAKAVAEFLVREHLVPHAPRGVGP